MTGFSYAATDNNAQVDSANHSSYLADFFSQYQPQNAFDMIERLPGFSFDSGDNARGFGGNAGNVLIDGARPTAKSGGLVGALKRIPAEQVERIIIIRGGVSAGDAAGQSIVANVIKRKNVTSGTYALKFRRAPHGDLQPNIEAAISTNLGQWDGAFDIDIGFRPSFREAVVNRYDAHNRLVASANEERKNLGRFSFANGQLSRDFGDAKLTINGRVGANKWENNQFRNNIDHLVIDKSAIDSHWELTQENRFETAELGVDWVQKIGDWKWHSLGLGQIKTNDNESNANTSRQELISDTILYDKKQYKSEYIIRNTYGYIGNSQFKPEFGVELARNYLDSYQKKIVNAMAIKLPNAVVQVSENRAEIFASFVYSYDAKLSIDGGLTAEFSEIEVTGDAFKEQRFYFIKPRLGVNYKLSDDMHLVLQAQHVVGQLNFNDFAASSSVEDNRDVSGNSNLKPDQNSELSAEFDWNYSKKGSLKVIVYHDWSKDILEEIELEGGTYGQGNAGKATSWGIDIELAIPTDGFLDNGLFEITYDYSDSRFDDNIIGTTRHISDHVPHDVDANFRQDLVEQKLAWGLRYNGRFINTDYRGNEISKFEANHRLGAFIETSYFTGYKVQLEVSNLNVSKFTRTRTFFENNRSGTDDGYEMSSRRREPEYKLSIWGTF